MTISKIFFFLLFLISLGTNLSLPGHSFSLDDEVEADWQLDENSAPVSLRGIVKKIEKGDIFVLFEDEDTPIPYPLHLYHELRHVQ